jgi:phosphoribosylaminoimidazole-succinocarboxamide synthase
MSLWWFEQLADLVPNHVVSTEVPDAVRNSAVICEPLEMFPVECVARGYLTGSGLLDYRRPARSADRRSRRAGATATDCPSPIFTPATKAAFGDHDENVDSFDAVEPTSGATTLRSCAS